jgi:hypothetical protein
VDALIKELADLIYLAQSWYVVIIAQDNLAATPNAYAQFLNSIVGMLVALVNMSSKSASEVRTVDMIPL